MSTPTEEMKARARRVITACLTENNVCLHRDVAIFLTDAVAGEMDAIKREVTAELKGAEEEGARPEGIS